MAVVLCVATGVASAAPKLPKPGTPMQVAALVSASTSIETLPANLLPALIDVASDNPGAYFGEAAHGCDGVDKCIFGDLKSKHTWVLFGDSHAEMWLPALNVVAKADGYRLVLLWMPGCPAATLTVWDSETHSVLAGCDQWRTSMIGAINALDPAMALLADRTSDVHGPGNQPISNATWKEGLETTITDLESSTTQVAVIGDVTAFYPINIPGCLAAYPNAVQKCSVKNPNPKSTQHFKAEMAAAAAEDVPYFNPQPWLCRSVCSQIIGNMVAYYDNFHVSATYAEYLSDVWRITLAPYAKHSSSVATARQR